LETFFSNKKCLFDFCIVGISVRELFNSDLKKEKIGLKL